MCSKRDIFVFSDCHNLDNDTIYLTTKRLCFEKSSLYYRSLLYTPSLARSRYTECRILKNSVYIEISAIPVSKYARFDQIHILLSLSQISNKIVIYSNMIKIYLHRFNCLHYFMLPRKIMLNETIFFKVIRNLIFVSIVVCVYDIIIYRILIFQN